MKDTIILYYSYSGNTQRYAQRAATELGADIVRLNDRVHPGGLKVFFAGCPAAIRMKRWPVEPVTVDLSQYHKIVLYAPIWAGYPAPVANNVFDWLPAGKDVEVYLVSGSGKSSAQQKVYTEVEQKGCRLAVYKNLRQSDQK